MASNLQRSGWALVLPDADEPYYRIYSEGFSQEMAEELTSFMRAGSKASSPVKRNKACLAVSGFTGNTGNLLPERYYSLSRPSNHFSSACHFQAV